MWAQYKKTLVVTQLMILAVCCLVLYVTHGNLANTLGVFLVMQLGGVIGAWYGVRLRDRVLQQTQRLPLRR